MENSRGLKERKDDFIHKVISHQLKFNNKGICKVTDNARIANHKFIRKLGHSDYPPKLPPSFMVPRGNHSSDSGFLECTC